MRKILLLIILFTSLFEHDLKAQNPINEVNAQLRALFSPLQRPTPSPLFLYEMAAHMVDTTFYQHQSPDTSNTDNWFMLYEELRNTAYDTTQYLHPDSLYISGAQFGRDTIPMGIINVDMHAFKYDALTTPNYFYFDTVNTILTDRPGRPNEPYRVFEVFSAAPMLSEATYTEVTFFVDPSFFITDEFNENDFTEDGLRIDFGDGMGWKVFNNSISPFHTVNYPSAGRYKIKVGIFDGVNIINLSYSFIDILLTGSATQPDDVIVLPGLTAGVYPSCGSNAMEKTIIYLEGWDMKDNLPFFNRDVPKIYDNMIRDEQLAQLRNFGYNFVVVDWWNSRIDIKENAEYLSGLINHLVEEMGENQQFVIIGESMGGLVARYALAAMDNGTFPSSDPDKKHNTRLLITLDTPHLGANLPISIQQLYASVFDILPSQAMVSADRVFMNIFNVALDGMAAKQMLVYHIDTESYVSSSVNSYTHHFRRTLFTDDLENLEADQEYGDAGRPYKIVALSNGSLSGERQTQVYSANPRSPGDYLLNFDGSLYLRVFGINFKYFGVDLKMHTNPSGVGQTLKATAGTLGIKIKLKFWKIRITTTYNNLLNIEKKSDLEPYCVNAGGYINVGKGNMFTQDQTNGFDAFIFKVKTTNSPGQYTFHAQYGIPWLTNNAAFNIQSQGFHFAFVPTMSALHYNHPDADRFPYAPFLTHDILNENISVKTSDGTTPFNVLIGEVDMWPPNNDNYRSRYNRHHLQVRNEPIDVSATCGNPIETFVLNREIGDEQLYLSNFNLPYYADYEAEYDVFVNEFNPYYRYSSSNPGTVFSGMYSKEKAFTTISGHATFYYGANFNQGSPQLYPSQYEEVHDNMENCCIDYLNFNARYAASPTTFTPTANVLLDVYPNPASGSLSVKYRFPEVNEVQITLTDGVGRTVVTLAEPMDIGGTGEVIVDLRNLTPGLYLVQTVAGNERIAKKLIIQ